MCSLRNIHLQWRPKVRSPPLQKKCFWSNFSSLKYLLLKFSPKTRLVTPYQVLNFWIPMARVCHVRSIMEGKGGERTFGHNFVFSLLWQRNGQTRATQQMSNERFSRFVAREIGEIEINASSKKKNSWKCSKKLKKHPISSTLLWILPLFLPKVYEVNVLFKKLASGFFSFFGHSESVFFSNKLILYVLTW